MHLKFYMSRCPISKLKRRIPQESYRILFRPTVNIEKKHFKADCNEESGIMPRKAVDLMIQLASSRIIFCTPLAVPLVKTCIQNENWGHFLLNGPFTRLPFRFFRWDRCFLGQDHFTLLSIFFITEWKLHQALGRSFFCWIKAYWTQIGQTAHWDLLEFDWTKLINICSMELAYLPRNNYFRSRKN